MSSNIKTKDGPPRARLWRVFFILWLTLLSFGLPEVIAGSGAMWIVNPGTYLLVMPLYILHFLVLVQVALWSGRTSWPALYLFGVIFGLYETWITKVVWAGYQGSSEFAFGGIGPWFGLHETFGIVFFYHAVISFLLPLAVMSRLFPSWGRVFPVPDWVFGSGKWALQRRLGLVLMLGVVSSTNMPEPLVYLGSWVPLLILLYLGYAVLHKTGANRVDDARALAISSPRLRPTAAVVALCLLVLVYVVPYFLSRPEALPPFGVQLITFGIYPLLGLMVYCSSKSATPQEQPPPAARPASLPMRWLLAIFGLGSFVLLLAVAGFDLRGVLAPVSFVLMIPLGIVLFLWLGIWRGFIRRR